jgi:hypothetical protein
VEYGVFQNNRCRISNSKFGICGMRQNREGTLYTYAYGKVVAANVDPIEKKPLSECSWSVIKQIEPSGLSRRYPSAPPGWFKRIVRRKISGNNSKVRFGLISIKGSP